jgi:hypothetical protein
LYAEARRQAQNTGLILISISLHDFLNPIDEDLAVEEETTLGDIIEQHTGQYLEDENAILEDGEPAPQEITSAQEAISAVQTLLNYQIRQEQAMVEDIRFLQCFERASSVAEASQ